MKKIIIVLILFIIFPLNVLAVSLDTKAIIVMDLESGRVFYEKDAYNKRLIASTTKIMTAILAIESNKLENIVTIDEEVLSMYGSNTYIEMGEHILLIDLVYGLMLRSGNDASVAIANMFQKM
jgi:D-alanyl-D-alanine carboxypeptidase